MNEQNKGLESKSDFTGISVKSYGGADMSCKNDSINPESDMEISDFMQTYIDMLFDPSVDIDQVSKQKFGQLCQTCNGREMFAKYVNKQRCIAKEVTETTFYKLAQSFALVLFECYDADDFSPSKTLMNMMFTFYYIPDPRAFRFSVTDHTVIELKSPDCEFVDTYFHDLSEDSESDNINPANLCTKETPKKSGVFSLKKNQSPHHNKKSMLKTANNWLKKEFGTFLFLPSEKSGSSKENDAGHSKVADCDDAVHPSSIISDEIQQKMFLYEALRRQPIWKSLRFWNAAFFDAVNSERQCHFQQTSWNTLSADQRVVVSQSIQNATFGQLGTFINNMKHLGLGQKTCMEFLRKQSIIGNLNKEHYQLLKQQVEMPIL